jgi:hypothetical protein
MIHAQTLWYVFCFDLSGKASFRTDPQSIKLVLDGFQREGNIFVSPSYQFHAAAAYMFDFHTFDGVSKYAKLLPKGIESEREKNKSDKSKFRNGKLWQALESGLSDASKVLCSRAARM